MDSASICGHRMDDEFGYFYTGSENTSPEVQSNFVEIMGMNGSIDLTEQDGTVFYNSIDRQWRFEKVTRVTNVDDVEKEARLLRRYILKSGIVIFDSDPEYYYNVRITRIDVSCEDGGRIVALISAHCQPYRYRVEESKIVCNVSDTADVELYNEQLAISPLVITDSEMQLDYTIKGASHHVVVDAGEHYIDTLVLYEGKTVISVSGSGNIIFRYRQGAL